MSLGQPRGRRARYNGSFWFLVAWKEVATGRSLVRRFFSDGGASRIVIIDTDIARGHNMVVIFCQWNLAQPRIAIIGWVSQVSDVSSTGILDAPYRAFVIAAKCPYRKSQLDQSCRSTPCVGRAPAEATRTPEQRSLAQTVMCVTGVGLDAPARFRETSPTPDTFFRSQY